MAVGNLPGVGNEGGTLERGVGGGKEATLTTRNRMAVLNRLQSEYYDNLYKTLNTYYKDLANKQKNAVDDILTAGEKVLGLLMAGSNIITKGPSAIAFDLLSGGLSSTGDAVLGLTQMTAKFVTDAWAVLNEGDGRGASEDLSYMVSSAVANIAKGLGTIGTGLFAGAKTGVGFFIPSVGEDAFEKAALTDRQIENFLNTEVIGRAVQKGREMDQGPSSEQNQLDRMYGQPKEEQPFEESEFNSNEYVKQYIDDRYSEIEPFVKFTESAIATNRWYQDNIAKPVGEQLDNVLPPEYKKWVEPAANSIGRLLPSIALSMISSGTLAANPAVSAGFATASKAFFVSNVYGSSYQTAIESGASYNDAHIYAQANAMLELGTEMIGGWKPGKFSPKDMRNILKNIRTEAIEESLAEITGDGLSYWLSPDRQIENVKPSELLSRTAYSAIVGGLSGGIFGGIGTIKAQTDLGTNASIVSQELSKVLNPKDGSKPQQINQEELNKATEVLLNKLNDPKTPQWRKQEILDNPIIKELVQTEVNEVESPQVNLETGEVSPKAELLYTYKLSDIGQRITEGKVFAKQGQQEINKEEYAVGAQELLFDYLEEVPVGQTARNAQGEVIETTTPTKIEILKNEEVNNLNKAQQESINWFRERNIRVAFVKGPQKGSFAAFTDPKTGMIYVNVNSINNESGYKNVFAHEMHDKMEVLFRDGKLTKKQMDAYVKFRNAIDAGQFDNILNQVGWNEVAEIYTRQTFTEQQKADVEKFGGWNKVPLTQSQKDFVNREKISWVIGEVFDNNKILRNAFGQKPSILRSIANIFANTNKFKTQMGITGAKADVRILSNMLNNMQKNFQQLLIEGKEFAFGYESIGDTFRLQKVMNTRPGIMFSYEIMKPGSVAGTIIAKSRKSLIESLSDKKAISSILDVDESSEFYQNEILPYINGTNTQPINLLNKRVMASLNIANKGVTFLEGNQKQQFDNINGGDYFLKIGNQLYDRNDFKLPPDIKPNTDIEFTFNDGIFEITYERNPKAVENDNDYSFYEDILYANPDSNYNDFNIIRVYPDFLMSDGRIQKKAHMLISSLNPAAIDDAIDNDGKVFAQSISFVPAGKSKTLTQWFERPFQDNGHIFTVSQVYKPEVVSKKGFMVFQRDSFTPIRVFYNNEFIADGKTSFNSKQIYDDSGVDPNVSFIVKRDMVGLEYTKPKYTRLSKDNAYMLILKSLQDMQARALESLENRGVYFNVADLDAYSQEAYILDENAIKESIAFLTNEVVDFGQSLMQNTTGQPDITPAMLKERIGVTPPSVKEIVAKAEKASNAIVSIFNRNMSVGKKVNLIQIGQSMAMARFPNIAEASKEQAVKAYNEYIQNKQQYDAILDFYNIMNFQTSEYVVEMKASELNIADDVAAVNINHSGSNKNSPLYKKIKSFYESKGVKVIETATETTLEDSVDFINKTFEKVGASNLASGKKIFSDFSKNKIDLKKEDGNYDLNHPVFQKYNQASVSSLVNTATQSVMDNFTEEGTNSDYLFALDKKTPQSKRKKKIDASQTATVEETEAIIKSRTKTTTRKFNQPRKTVQKPIESSDIKIEDGEIRRLKIDRVRALKEQLESLKKERTLALDNNDSKGVIAAANRMKTVKAEIKALEQQIENKQAPVETQQAPVQETQPAPVETQQAPVQETQQAPVQETQEQDLQAIEDQAILEAFPEIIDLISQQREKGYLSFLFRDNAQKINYINKNNTNATKYKNKRHQATIDFMKWLLEGNNLERFYNAVETRNTQELSKIKEELPQDFKTRVNFGRIFSSGLKSFDAFKANKIQFLKDFIGDSIIIFEQSQQGNVVDNDVINYQVENVKSREESNVPPMEEAPVENQQPAPVEQTQETVEVVVQEQVDNAPVSVQELSIAYDIAKRQSKTTYKAAQKAFKKFLDNVLAEVEQQPEEEFKDIIKIFQRHNVVIRQDIRGSLYINHMSEAMLKALVEELSSKRLAIKKDTVRTDLQFTNPEIKAIVNRVYESIFSSMAQMEDISNRDYITEENPNGLIYNRYSHNFLRDFLKSDISNPDVLDQFNNDSRGDFFRRLINAIYNINDENGIQELNGAIENFIRATEVDKVNTLSLNEEGTLRTIDKVKQEWQRNTEQVREISEEIDYSVTPLKFRVGKKVVGSLSSYLDPYTFLEIQSLFNKLGWGNVFLNKLEQGVERQIDVDRIFERIIQEQEWLKKHKRQLKDFDDTKLFGIFGGKKIAIENLNGAQLPMTQIITLRNVLLREILRNRAIDLGIILGEKSSHFENGNIVQILALVSDYQMKKDNAQRAVITDNLKLLEELNNIIQADSLAVELNDKVMTFFNEVYPLINERYSAINGQPLQSEGREIKSAIEEGRVSADDVLVGLPSNITVDMLDKIYIPIAVGDAGYFREKDVDFQKILNIGVSDGFTESISESNAIVKIDSIISLMYKYKKEARNYWGLHSLMKSWNDLVNEELPITPRQDDMGQLQSVNMKEYISAEAIDYVEKIMKDSAGYSSGSAASTPVFSFLRRNFYRYVLGANFKVILTQLTTLYNLSMLYGDGNFYPKMVKNVFMQISSKNKQEIAELAETNNIYYDRTFVPTYDLQSAQGEDLEGFMSIFNVLMSGISKMDTVVNRAFYLTLLETVNKETGANYTKQEANKLLKKGILRSQSSALNLGKAPILRTDNEILRVLLKFMGEPLKLQSQIYASKKQLELIRKLKKKNKNQPDKSNQRVIEERLLQQEAKALENVGNEERTLRQLRTLEESEDFATMENEEQQQIRNNIELQEQRVEKAKAVYEDTSIYSRTSIDQMKEIVNQEKEAHKLLRRRISALIGTMFYMAALNTLWVAVLKNLGKLDDREEEEELFNYLMRKFGSNFVGEFFQLLPFIRDFYGFIADNYDIDSIDELSLFQDGLGAVIDSTRKLIQGEELKPWEYARDLGMFVGKTFGIGTGNIENLFIQFWMLTGQQDTYYRYRDATGQRISSNKELSQAIKDGNDELVQAIVNSKIASRRVSVSNATLDEVIRLARLQQNVNITGIKESYVIDGVEYVMDEKQMVEFRGIYNQADLIVQRMLTSSSYRRLNDSKKKSLIQSIYNYYLRLAQSKVFDLDLVPDNRMFRSLTQAFNYFRETVATRLLNQQRNEERESRRR